MAIIRVHKNPLKQAPEVFNVDHDINLLHWLAESPFKSMGESGAVVSLNGRVIADSGKHEDLNERINVVVSKHDQVDVISRANGLDPLTALIVVGAALIASVVLLPKPQIPNDAGSSKTSPNNQLNAATNSYRPNQAVPNVYGEVVVTPDFIQRSYYTYINNRRQFVEIFGVSLGRGVISEVKDGSTLFDDLPTSSYEVFGPGVTPTGLVDVRSAEGSIDLPVDAPDVNVVSYNIYGASFFGGNTIICGADAISELNVTIGDTISFELTYEIDGVPGSYSGSRTVSSIGTDSITLSGGTIFPAGADISSVNGLLTNESASPSDAEFVLDGTAISAVRFHVSMPSGIRGGTGNNVTVSFNMSIQEIDEFGGDIGSPQLLPGAFINNTQQYLGATFEFSGLTPSRYKAKIYRVTPSLGTNAADRLVLERIESVTPYTTTFPDMTIIRTNRSSSPMQPRGASQKINLLWQRELEIFNPATGTFGAYAATRSFAQAVMDVLVNRCGVPVSNIDYETLFAIETALADPRLGYFDFSFDDSDVGAKQFVQTICNVARVSAYEIASGNWRFVRDELKSARVALFNRRNVAPSSSKLSGKFQRGLDFDSVEVRYVDPNLNTTAFVRKRINPTTGAIENGLGVRVQKMELAGCRNQYQAENRAQREIGRIRYQRIKVAERTHMDALALGIGERVGWGYIADSKIFTGEIQSQSGNVFTTSEKFEPEAGQTYYVYISNDDGSTSNTVICTARSDGNQFGFEAAGLTAYTADGFDIQMGSIYMIATDSEAHDYIITKRGKPNQAGIVEVELVNYDERAYPAE